MQNVSDVIDLYLSMDTSYAIMITGPWGVGKTHYVTNALFSNIQKTEVFENAKKKYKPVIISLFGQKSIEDIQVDILVSLYPILGNKFAKLSASIAKGLLKGFLKLKGADQFNESIDNVKVKSGDWINFNEIVIFFDDLERRDEKLSLDELIGFINSLVEGYNIKVIIITNEGKLKEDNYHQLKEKTIGNTVHFIPEIEQSIRSIIKTKFSGSPAFRKHLEDNIESIVEFFMPYSQNLRIISFCLSYYQFVFSSIDDVLINVKVIESRKEEILRNILQFAISISIEYQEGNVSFTDRKDLDRRDHLPLHALFAEKSLADSKKEIKEEDKAYYKRFDEKYYQGNNYFFYGSIYDFLTGGGKLSSTRLEAELRRLFHIEQNVIPPHYALLEELNHPNVYTFNDKEYIIATKKLLSFAEQGLFEIFNYVSIFYFVFRFGNPLRIHPDRLQARIIAGMKKGLSHYSFDPQLEIRLGLEQNDPNFPYLKEIASAGLHINKKLGMLAAKTKSDKLQKLFLSDLDGFMAVVLNKQGSFYSGPVFHQFNAEKSYRYLLRLDNDSLVKVIRLLYDRRKSGYATHFADEKPFFAALETKIQKKALEKKGKNISGFIFNDLHHNITEYIKGMTP
jgi:hypothetical protein